MMRKSWRVVLFCSLLTLCGCSHGDRKGDLIVGDWDLQEAVRQGRPTSTLDGLRFTISDDSLYTNLPVFENNPYEYAHDTITILSRNPYSFHVFHVDSTHLDLLGDIQRVRFRLKFQKIKP